MKLIQSKILNACKENMKMHNLKLFWFMLFSTYTFSYVSNKHISFLTSPNIYFFFTSTNICLFLYPQQNIYNFLYLQQTYIFFDISNKIYLFVCIQRHLAKKSSTKNTLHLQNSQQVIESSSPYTSVYTHSLYFSNGITMFILPLYKF